jgi:hypothetical protein
MGLITTDGREWPDVAPQAGSRSGWHPKKFRRLGMALCARPDGGFDRYGIYGVRGGEIFVQCEGREADGRLSGLSGFEEDTDLRAYFWAPASDFTGARVFDERAELSHA